MDISKAVLNANSFAEFNPMQLAALKANPFEGNLIISSPTASGKTIIAELCALHSIINNKRKVIYTCPLRALASEHYNDFKRKYSGLDIKSTISTGDLDSSSSYLQNYDVIFTTYEKCLPADEFIIYKYGQNLEISTIGNFFKLLESKSRVLNLGNKTILIPFEDFFTPSYSKQKKKIIFSKVQSVQKIRNSEKLLQLTLSSGRRLSLTEKHKLFSLDNGKIKKIEACNALNKSLIAMSDLSDVFSEKITQLNLFELFLGNDIGQLGAYFDHVDFDELVSVLTTPKRSRRRAKQHAKYYLKQKWMPMKIAKNMKKIQVNSISGLRTDSIHKMSNDFLLSKEFGKFLGYFISEGSFSTPSEKFGFKHLRFPMIEERMIEDMQALCNACDFPFRYYNKSRELHVVSRPLFFLFRDIFKIGKSADKKQIPAQAFFFNDNFIKGLLEGLFAGDGGPSPRAIEYSTKNYVLALQVSLLLLRFNIHAYIYPQKIIGRKETYWRVAMVGGKNLKRFLTIAPKTKPIIEKTVAEIVSAPNVRDSMFENTPVRAFFNEWPKGILVENHHTIYSQWRRNQRTEKKRLADFLKKCGMYRVSSILSEPIAFLNCLKIKGFDKIPEYVFNLQTNSGNYFTANGILIKNCDSLIRHRAEWLSAVGLLMIDEVHELDSNRGATLEVLITKMLSLNPKLQLLALSATIPNAKEIAKWLNAKLVESDFRPVKLREGIYFNEEIIFDEKKKQKEIIDNYKEPLHSIVKNTLELKNKQALIFANTRKRAESIAKSLAPLTEKMLIEREKAHLKRKSAEALNALEAPTEQCSLLASLIEKGIAFHHAGLLQKQREIIEELFKSNCIKIISATPTLAMGVNLPAFRVIIPSLYRYEETYGQQRIPVREYKQLAGRSGRPRYDSCGESILIARSEDEVDELFENYVNGKIEEITSKLGIAPLLRMHVLSAISDNFIFDLDSMEKFFSKTFYAYQYKNLSELFQKIQEIIAELQEMGFVESDAQSIKATKLGRRVSELYLDPISAYKIILALQQQRKKYGELFYLYALANTSEFSPLISAQKEKQAELYELAEGQKPHLPIDFDREQYQDPDILKKFSTSLLLQDWIDEISEQALTKSYNIQPGILHSKLRIADWLLYSALELAKLLQTEQHFTNLQKLRKRMEAGIKEELIALCEVRHIGRVRARRLFSSNIKGIGDLKSAPFESIARILGSAVAVKVKEQLGQEAQIPEEFKKGKDEKEKSGLAEQKALGEF